jgi:hypothetical protein
MYYFWLMLDETSPTEASLYPPYVTPDEAVKWAKKEARSRIQNPHLPRQLKVESQPWKTVTPEGEVLDR